MKIGRVMTDTTSGALPGLRAVQACWPFIIAVTLPRIPQGPETRRHSWH
jgi:hypothetical protein